MSRRQPTASWSWLTGASSDPPKNVVSNNIFCYAARVAHNNDLDRVVHEFRCLDGAHTFEQLRDPNGPLVLRQSAWCSTHDCPAVGVGEHARPERPVRRPA